MNGDVVKEAKTQVNEETDQIALMGEIYVSEILLLHVA